MSPAAFKAQCKQYLAERRSSYDFRCRRYDRVIRYLETAMGFKAKEKPSIVDVGAGTQDFKRRMGDWVHNPLETGHWYGKYIPIDGSIDGTDLNYWVPTLKADYYVCIEVLEHLHNPFRLMDEMVRCAKKGVIITTPNSDVVDTLSIDSTHVTPLYAFHFEMRGWKTQIHQLFGNPNDSIVAWFTK